MKKFTVMTVFGTRPEAIKMAPLVLALSQEPMVNSLCCVTAQHREMLDSVLDIFEIKPDYDLDIMSPSQSLSTITAKVLQGMDEILTKAKPDLVLVHGDTSTTFSAALACFYHQIPVGHVEAGLRTYDKFSPFPEEMNRVMVSNLADLHFCPTTENQNNLLQESITQGVYLTGNTVIDGMNTTVKEHFSFSVPLLNQLDYQERKVILVTCHRRENYGEPMEQIMKALRRLVEDFPETELVYPVHLAPVVQTASKQFLSDHPRIHLIPPLSVNEMHNLMARCYFVMTDSGGLQEEAPFLGKPVLVMRKETERPEAVTAGTVKLSGVEEDAIYADGKALIENAALYQKMAQAVNPYGDGKACERIVQSILYQFSMSETKPSAFQPEE
ncbi:MAG: UDP-N-acetylglucosamine 2-epimerase (non-hydrolyzing) [Eubacteriales bacterium]